MLKPHTLKELYPHSRGAAHGVEVSPGARWLFTNGQVGTRADGTAPDTPREQAIVVFERLQAILKAADMGFADVVRLNAYLVGRDGTQDVLDIRDAFLGAHKPATTFFYVSGLSRPGLVVEVEAVAAKDDAP